jgi:small conductance mechanosensitive channel
LAAAGFAVGLALQGTLANFSAGVMLLIFRPFKAGDVIDVAGVKGKVQEISLFTTELDTPDNRRLIVPNGSIFGSTIENVTFHPIRRVDVAVGTDYPADLNATRKVLEDAAASVQPQADGKEPQVYLSELGDSSIAWSVRVWTSTEDYWGVKEELTQKVKDALDEAGIGIPYPQMDVHMDGALERTNGS